MAAATAEQEQEEAAAALAALLGPAAGGAARAGAAGAALSLSGSAAGRRLLAGRPALLAALLRLAAEPGPGPARAARCCLLNVSAEPAARGALLPALPSLLPLLPDGPLCGLLANLSRERGAARAVLRALGPRWDALLQALARPRPPPELGPLLCNLSQVPEGRRGLLDRSRYGPGRGRAPGGRAPAHSDRPARRCSVQRLLPFTQYRDSAELRRGIVGALRNCCFEHEHHEWLLSEAVDILPFLLLPLAGPEELPQEDMERKWVLGQEVGAGGGHVSPTEGACPQGCPRTCSTYPRTSSARRSPTSGGCCWRPSCCSRPRGPGGAWCGTWARTWCCGSCTAGSSTPGCGRPASACCRW
uniref:HGH1 homolog n=1 Tax=Strigops habroptila TaxID=2489341 RepID=A0A672TJE3_STRHB